MLGITHPMINSLFYPRRALLLVSMAILAVLPDAHASVQATAIAPAVNGTILTVPAISLQLSLKDGLLSKALAAFATEHGWTVSWELDRDFPIDFPARFDGSFLKIIEQVAVALQSSETPIRVKAYHGNHVLRVLAATQ